VNPPSDLQHAAEIALADVVAGTGKRGWLTYEHQDNGRWMVVVSFGTAATGVFVEAGADWPELLAQLADGIQEAYIDDYSETWPPCPGHRHPVWPGVDDRTAVWACPVGEWQVPIGELAALRRD
jgi:hypothetical protein